MKITKRISISQEELKTCDKIIAKERKEGYELVSIVTYDSSKPFIPMSPIDLYFDFVGLEGDKNAMGKTRNSGCKKK